MNSRASRMPNWAEEMVAPVVGETNLFMQSCCMIRPATLIPTPVHRMASSRGSRERRKISHWSQFPDSRLGTSRSITPYKEGNHQTETPVPPPGEEVAVYRLMAGTSSVS